MPEQRPGQARPAVVTGYELRIAGRLDSRWSGWFADFSVIAEPDGTTILRGTIADQSELHGVLARIRDLGLTLVSVVPVEEEVP
jgi:hypothetical protein